MQITDTLSPQLQPQFDPLPDTTRTPHELQRQPELCKQYLNQIDLALDQLLKRCEMARHCAVLLTSQNEKLIAGNYRQNR